MAGTITSLYIDDSSIRLMVTRGKKISKLASVPMEISLNEIDSPEKENELAEKLKNLFTTNKISDRKVILGVSGLHCLTRPAVLPVLPKAMIQEAVIREARRVLPIPPEQLYLSWQLIKTTPENLTIFMAGIPRELGDTIIRILQQADLKPYLMDIKPLALARLATEPTCVIVDVQAMEFDLVVMSAGMPHPVRTVPFADDLLSSSERAAIISDELERTVQFFNSNNPEQPLMEGTKLFFSGDLSDEPELCEELSQRLTFTAEQLTSPFKSLKHLESSHHLVNIGLTLKEHKNEKRALLPDFNALPEPYLPKQISTKKLMMLPAGIAAAAVIVFLIINIQNAGSHVSLLENQLDTNNLLYERKLKERTELSQAIQQIEGQVIVLETALTGAEQVTSMVTNRGNDLDADINASVKSIVPQLGLSEITWVAGNFGISGVASSEEEVIAYARTLTETGRFEEITIQRVEYTESSDEYRFNLVIRLPQR